MFKKTLFIMLTIFCANTYAEDPSEPYAPSKIRAELKVDVEKDVDCVHFVRDNADPDVVTKTYILKHADPYEVRKYLREIVQTRKIDECETGIATLKYADGTGVIMVSAEDYRFEDATNGLGIDTLIELLDRPKIESTTGQENFIYCPKYRAASELKKILIKAGANVANDVTENIGGEDRIQCDHELNVIFCRTTPFSRKNIETLLKKYDVPYPEVKIKLNVYELYAENDATLGVDFQSWKNNDGVELLNSGVRARTNYGAPPGDGMVYGMGAAHTQYYNFNPKWNTKYIDFLVSKGKADVLHTCELSVRNQKTAHLAKFHQVFNPQNENIESPSETQEYLYVADGTFVSQPPQGVTTITGWIAEDVYVLNALSLNNQSIRIKDVQERSGPAVSISILKLYKNYQARYFLEISGSEFIVNGVPVGTQIEARAADVMNYTAAADNAIGSYNWTPTNVQYEALNEITTWKGKFVNLIASDHFGFEMHVTPVIGAQSTMLDIEVGNSSLIGYRSDGSPRIQKGNILNTQFMIRNQGAQLVIGGLQKSDVVRSVTGIPILKDIPGLGWLFSTEGESTKKSQLVVVAEVMSVNYNTPLPEETQKNREEITGALIHAGETNTFGYRQYLLDSERHITGENNEK